MGRKKGKNKGENFLHLKESSPSGMDDESASYVDCDDPFAVFRNGKFSDPRDCMSDPGPEIANWDFDAPDIIIKGATCVDSEVIPLQTDFPVHPLESLAPDNIQNPMDSVVAAKPSCTCKPIVLDSNQVKPQVTYASMLLKGSNTSVENSILNNITPQDQAQSALKKPSIKDGSPALIFSDEEICELSKPFRFALVGKFSYGRPSLIDIKIFFITLKLSNDYSIGLLDGRHILVNLKNSDDFSRLFSKTSFLINGFLVRFLKWTPYFDFSKEPPFKPVWLSFPKLRLQFMNSSTLTSLGNIFGRTLLIDKSTLNLSRPSLTRILVEVDLLKDCHQRVWLGTSHSGYWQEVVFENMPKYCQTCFKIGHDDIACRSKKHNTHDADSLVVENVTNSDNLIGGIQAPMNITIKEMNVASQTKDNYMETFIGKTNSMEMNLAHQQKVTTPRINSTIISSGGRGRGRGKGHLPSHGIQSIDWNLKTRNKSYSVPNTDPDPKPGSP